MKEECLICKAPLEYLNEDLAAANVIHISPSILPLNMRKISLVSGWKDPISYAVIQLPTGNASARDARFSR